MDSNVYPYISGDFGLDTLQSEPHSRRYEEIARVTQAQEDLYKNLLPFGLGPPLSPPTNGHRTQVFQNNPAPELVARGFCLVPKGSEADLYAETLTRVNMMRVSTGVPPRATYTETPVNMTGVSAGASPRATLTPNEVDSTPTSTPTPAPKPDALIKQRLGVSEAIRSLRSSTSVLSDHSDLSSPPPSISSTSKATTPVESDNPQTHAPSQVRPPLSVPTARKMARRRYDVRPKVSIPPDMTMPDYAMQCIAAAESSRLLPYSLHEDEWKLLRDHISHAQVTTYLNIRNGILRLWTSNPQVMVTREEAIGCAKDSRWFDVANVCYEWLARNGYINFGCVQFRASRPSPNLKPAPKEKKKRRTIVVIGAGMSGLGCARQLEGLVKQNIKRFREMGEDLPEVIVLEGRDRVGGRVFSRDFKSKPTSPLPVFKGKRVTAEMGGMIITGFERGNPLNILVRGQLGLPYHKLRSDTTLYDSTGQAVDPTRDQMVETLYNDCLARVSEYKFKKPPTKLIEGKKDLVDEGKDSAAEGSKTIAYVEDTIAQQQHHALPVSQQNMAPQVELHPVSTDRLTGRVHVEPGSAGTMTAAYKAELSGWELKPGVSKVDDVDLDSAAAKKDATLGSVMDDVFNQFKNIVDLGAQDFRMLNWHVANLEYSNAINYNQLSLQGWDIDAGYEWDGKHTMIIGGYQQVPLGLSLSPTPLDVRKKSPVTRIRYSPDLDNPSGATVECEDGSTIDADYVVNTIPLGVLKHGSVQFDPPLPSRKIGAIERLGYGVLNKVILIFKEAFWDESRDIFGVLRYPPVMPDRHSLNQQDYSKNRGRFFQWFNISNTSGVPCLLALMAGDAGFDVEGASNNDLVSEATSVLRSVFGPEVPEPEETFVTRWASDKFARGSYSSTGPQMNQDDYDIMKEPVGNLFFAGEHTIGSYPATVHGAYLSGLRAASEVINSILGPIDIPTPLILPRDMALRKRKVEDISGPTAAQRYDEQMWNYIVSQIGPEPVKPVKAHYSAWSFFVTDRTYLEEARRRCNEGRRPGKAASSKDVRDLMAKMWKKEMTEELRVPFEAKSTELKVAHNAAVAVYNVEHKDWTTKRDEIMAKYKAEHPFVPDPEEVVGGAARRSATAVRSYQEPDSDVEMEE